MALINNILLVFKREPAVERCVEFAAKYVASVEEPAETDSSLLQLVLEHLVGLHEAKDKAVRFRVCQLIAKIMNSLDDEADMDEELCQSILDAMLVRVTDKIPVVRMQAINALCRLQDPTDEDCPVIAAYVHCLATDASPDVRRTVLTQLAINKTTLAAILARTRDIKVGSGSTIFLQLNNSNNTNRKKK